MFFKNEIQLYNELKRLYRDYLDTDIVNVEFILSISELILVDDKYITHSKKLRLMDKYFKDESNRLNLNFREKSNLTAFKLKCLYFLNSNK